MGFCFFLYCRQPPDRGIYNPYLISAHVFGCCPKGHEKVNKDASVNCTQVAGAVFNEDFASGTKWPGQDIARLAKLALEEGN